MIKKAGKRKILLGLFAAMCACGIGATLTIANAENSEAVTFSDANIESEYVTNAVFETPKVIASYNGTDYETECTIVFPDGKTTYSDLFVLNQSGKYSLTYSAVIGNKTYEKEYEFVTMDTSGSLFTTQKASISFGLADFYEEIYGAQVTAEPGATIEYNKVINLSQNTKNDELIELVATPHELKKEDFSQIYVTLTDIYDEENFVSIKIHSAKNNSRYRSYVQAKAPGQRYCGLESGRPNFGIIAGGLVISHSFGAYFPLAEKNVDKTIKLCFDYEERAIYADEGGLAQLALDLDDVQYISKPWGGFTTGEVKLTITIGDVVGQPRFVIKSIDGNRLTGDYPVDEKAPTLLCDIPADIPLAVVDKKYPIFAVTAWDNCALESLSAKVYYRYGTGNEVNVSVIDGCFIPNKVGEYTIVYLAKDGAGNVSQKVVPIQSCAVSDITPLTISIADSGMETKQLGENIYLRPYDYFGGVGYENVTIELKNGENTVQTITKDIFNVYQEGEYEVVYTVTDYVGNRATEKYPLTIIGNTEPILLEEIVLPKAFISGLSYDLPQVNAYDYYSGQEILIPPTITATINGNNITVNNGSVTPSATTSGEQVKIVYEYVNSNGGKTLWEKNVPIVIVKSEVGAIEQNKYFYTDGFTVATQADSLVMTTSQSMATAVFVRPVQAHDLVLSIGYANAQFTSEWFDVIIADKYNTNEIINIRIYKDNKVSVNNGEKTSVSIETDEAKTMFTINYNNATRSFSDSLANVFGKVNQTVNGEEFNGFSSNEVFVTIQAGNISGESKLYFALINNQPMNKSGRDNIAPQIYINELLGGSVEKGETIKIYPACAYDVLHDITSLTVTLRNLDTNEVLKDVNSLEMSSVPATEEYAVKLTAYGRYQVQYEAKDAAGKRVTATKIINVFDDQPPTITVNGKMPTSAKLNETITVPAYVVKDGQSEECTSYLIAIAPNGEITYFVTQFTPDQVGVWTICYFAMDANGQMATLEYKITVA